MGLFGRIFKWSTSYEHRALGMQGCEQDERAPRTASEMTPPRGPRAEVLSITAFTKFNMTCQVKVITEKM